MRSALAAREETVPTVKGRESGRESGRDRLQSRGRRTRWRDCPGGDRAARLRALADFLPPLAWRHPCRRSLLLATMSRERSRS